jgi:hypothetical protein
MANDPIHGFVQLLTGKQHARPVPQVKGPQEGRILSVDEDAATAMFVLKEFDNETHRFGPAPFGRTDTPPQVGDRCLVVFVGNELGRGWITSWQEPS